MDVDIKKKCIFKINRTIDKEFIKQMKYLKMSNEFTSIFIVRIDYLMKLQNSRNLLTAIKIIFHKPLRITTNNT